MIGSVHGVSAPGSVQRGSIDVDVREENAVGVTASGRRRRRTVPRVVAWHRGRPGYPLARGADDHLERLRSKYPGLVPLRPPAVDPIPINGDRVTETRTAGWPRMLHRRHQR